MNRMKLAGDQDGAVLVEATVMMTLFFVFILGSIDFLLLFYQWNAASKAAAVGARIAAVSDPVAVGLNSLSAAAVSASLSPPGGGMPYFQVTCNGGTASCICEGACAGISGYDAAAMSTIVFGRGSTSCGDSTSYYSSGMCDILPRITAANVVISYRQTGLGYAGRPGGPAPTITLTLQNLSFEFFFLGGLFGSNALRMPALTTSIVAEDLSSGAPSM